MNLKRIIAYISLYTVAVVILELIVVFNIFLHIKWLIPMSLVCIFIADSVIDPYFSTRILKSKNSPFVIVRFVVVIAFILLLVMFHSEIFALYSSITFRVFIAFVMFVLWLYILRNSITSYKTHNTYEP